SAGCRRRERFQVLITRPFVFSDFRYSDSTFTFTYIGGSKRYLIFSQLIHPK
uniref:Uncharacterized protein n=1 Tax=Meleagris gallopavo TaxID=9103 RepID=A0A803Y989_MELGA